MGEQHARGEINPFIAAKLDLAGMSISLSTKLSGLQSLSHCRPNRGPGPTANFMALTASTSFPFAVSGNRKTETETEKVQKKPNEQLNFEFFFSRSVWCFFRFFFNFKGGVCGACGGSVA